MLFLIIIVPIIIYVVVTRNKFNELQQAIKHEGSDIGIQIANRTQCLNDALNIAKLSYEKEVAGIEQLTANDKLEKLAFLGQKYEEILKQANNLNRNISASRQLLNGNIRVYNTAISNFPGVIIAAIFGYTAEKFIDEENYEKNKEIDKSDVDFTKF